MAERSYEDERGKYIWRTIRGHAVRIYLKEGVINTMRNGTIDEEGNPVTYTEAQIREQEKIFEKQAREIANTQLPEAEAVEPQITKDISEISEETLGHTNYQVGTDKETGNPLYSYDFRRKTRKSLERKIKDDLISGKTIEEASEGIYDNVRFTDLVDPEDYYFEYNWYTRKLQERGYEIVRVKNTMNTYNESNPYRGVNTVVASPEGYLFELQFHTPQSVEVKEVNHKLYEIARKYETPEEEKDRLSYEMYENSKQIENVPNAELIESFNNIAEYKQRKESKNSFTLEKHGDTIYLSDSTGGVWRTWDVSEYTERKLNNALKKLKDQTGRTIDVIESELYPL